MADDQQDTILPLRNASIVLPSAGRRRFKVDSAVLTPRGRHRVRLTFSGPDGSVIINMPRTVFWRMTELFHETSIHTDEEPGQRKRRGRS